MEQRKDRDEEFVAEFVKNGGNATQAAISVGVSEASARTIGYRLKMRLANDIDAEQREALKGYSSKALNQIQELAESAVSEKVKLDANKDLLDRAGWKPVDKSEVTEVNQWENASREELEAELLGYQQEWMENHLRSNNLKLVDASTGAETEEVYILP
jgi:phage terminase small subunit